MKRTKAPRLPFVLVSDGLAQFILKDGTALSRKDVKEVIDLAKKRCAYVKCLEVDGTCTGIRIGSGKVLTCWHVKQRKIRGKKIIGETITIDNKPAQILLESEKEDLLLLEADPDGLPSVSFGEVEEIDPVFWVGHPLGKSCLITQCSVMGIREKRIYITHEIQNGSSGSGVYFYTGELVGMIFEDKGGPKQGKISCARRACVLRRFLQEELSQFKLTG